MKTTRKIITVSVLGMMVLLASCNKETLSGRSSGGMNDEPPAGKSVSIIQTKRDFAAEVLARCMANYPDAYQQLNNVIAVVRSYGVDEHIYVHDILHREHSKFIPDWLEIGDLVAAIQEAELIANCEVEGEMYCGDLQLYWPYHEDWDNVTPPVVVFEPEVFGTPFVRGFGMNGGQLTEDPSIPTATMDYDKNSYLVIKLAEFPYTYYPRFVDGEFSKDGITWVRPTDVMGESGNWCYVDQVTGKDTLVEASVIGFQSSGTQHDSEFFGGGSEFVLTFANLDEEGTKNTHTYRLTMSRGEIEEEKTIHFDRQFTFYPSWIRECPDVYYRLYEEDSFGIPFDIDVNLSFGDASVSFELSGNYSDDEISSGYIGRDNYMNSCKLGNNGFGFSGEVVFFKARLFQPSAF